MRASPNAGFSTVELLAAVGVGVLVTAAVTFQLWRLNLESRTLSQRLDRADVTQELTRAFNQNGVCTCNVKDLALTPDPDSTASVRAVFPASRGLRAGCDATARTLAQEGQPLLRGARAFDVSRVLIANMQPLDAPVGKATRYLGDVTVEFGSGSSNLSLKPIKLSEVLYVRGSTVVGCGPPNHLFVTKVSDVSLNDLNGTISGPMVATATCPSDTRLVGGGFTTLGSTMPLGCEVGPFTNETLSNYGDGDNSWKVFARCRSVQARAVCLKMNPD